MPSGKILVVDDDCNLLKLLKMRLESANYEIATVLHGEDATAAVKSRAFDLSILDLHLGNQNGISLMKELRSHLPQMPVIILTAHGTIESAVEAVQQGAFNYLTKPFNFRDLLAQIEKALGNRLLTADTKQRKGLLEERYAFANIVARSEKMRKVLDCVFRIAKTNSTVYIYGESGTGKELIAMAIHLASERRGKPFLALNCAALPEPLLESELFGHEKGAFTGAIRSTRGVFTQAHRGTIFLDEIGDMPLGIQAKLLRVLQERHFTPLGSEKLVEVDVRAIVATNKDLEEEVKQGLFRGDLFYRIHVIPIYLPPLRERKEDIPALVEHFLKRFNVQLKREIKGLTPEAMQRLLFYEWPGNVRELENTIEFAMAMTQGNIISEEFIFPARITEHQGASSSLTAARGAFERSYLLNILQLCKGHVSEAAKLAGRNRTDFYSLLKKHCINPADFKKAD